ncbi:NIPSNAP-domain-containing protein [Abortiporus biennis]|nr:NIPSNAP-domain-containing protein [Abortiporus biennis]
MFARFSSRALRPVSSSVGTAQVQAKRTISVQSILHGSPDAQQEGDVQVQQHSKLVARGKYVHGFEIHHVKPEAVDAYKKAAEEYYVSIKDDPELHVKLSGSWQTVIGEQDTFFHILEYENYSGYDKTTAKIRNSEYIDTYKKMIPHLQSRSSQLCQEFAFFPTAPPHSEGGIFELRTYQLKPGALLAWEQTWRQGIEARRKFVAPVGAWFSQVGRLHQVHHMWQYPDLQTRKDTRERAWQLDGWAETVSKTAQFSKFMDSFILEPLPYSPLK